MRARRRSHAVKWGALGLLVVLGAACGSDAKPGTSGTTAMDHSAHPMDHGASTTLGHTKYPVTVKDCDGRATTYTAAPKRVVTIDPSITEMLLVLGLKDHIAGYTEFFAPDQQWKTTKPDVQQLKEINDGANYPSKETVVGLQPDLVTSVYSYAFADPLPTRDGWTQLGIHSYQALGSCTTDGKAPANFDLLYDDLRNLGEIFDVQDRAAREIDLLQTRVETLGAQAAELPTLKIAPYDGYEESPTTYGGMEGAVITAAGGTYIWSDLATGTTPSWEQFVAKNPDVIWIVPDAGKTVAELEQKLETDPRFANVTAVKNKAYVVVPQADATIESPRLVDGVKQMVDGLTALQKKS